MVLLDQTVEERFFRRAPHRTKLQRPDHAQRDRERRPVHGEGLHLPSWTSVPRCRVETPQTRRRQRNVSGAVKTQQQPSANHVARRAVRLLPSPGLAQQQRKPPACGLGMLGNQLADKFDLGSGTRLTAVTKRAFHAPERSRDGRRTQDPRYFFSSRHPPAATGAPPASPSDRPPPARLAVDALPASSPRPRPHGPTATSENALLITASAPAKIPGRHKPESAPPSRAALPTPPGIPENCPSAARAARQTPAAPWSVRGARPRFGGAHRRELGESSEGLSGLSPYVWPLPPTASACRTPNAIPSRWGKPHASAPALSRPSISAPESASGHQCARSATVRNAD